MNRPQQIGATQGILEGVWYAPDGFWFHPQFTVTFKSQNGVITQLYDSAIETVINGQFATSGHQIPASLTGVPDGIYQLVSQNGLYTGKYYPVIANVSEPFYVYESGRSHVDFGATWAMMQIYKGSTYRIGDFRVEDCFRIVVAFNFKYNFIFSDALIAQATKRRGDAHRQQFGTTDTNVWNWIGNWIHAEEPIGIANQIIRECIIMSGLDPEHGHNWSERADVQQYNALAVAQTSTVEQNDMAVQRQIYAAEHQDNGFGNWFFDFVYAATPVAVGAIFAYAGGSLLSSIGDAAAVADTADAITFTADELGATVADVAPEMVNTAIEAGELTVEQGAAVLDSLSATTDAADIVANTLDSIIPETGQVVADLPTITDSLSETALNDTLQNVADTVQTAVNDTTQTVSNDVIQNTANDAVNNVTQDVTQMVPDVTQTVPDGVTSNEPIYLDMLTDTAGNAWTQVPVLTDSQLANLGITAAEAAQIYGTGTPVNPSFFSKDGFDKLVNAGKNKLINIGVNSVLKSLTAVAVANNSVPSGFKINPATGQLEPVSNGLQSGTNAGILFAAVAGAILLTRK